METDAGWRRGMREPAERATAEGKIERLLECFTYATCDGGLIAGVG